MIADLPMSSPGTTSPDATPESKALLLERRASVRQKVHVPAYASVDAPSTGSPPHLSEILNIGEGGMAIQSLSPLEVHRKIGVFLDLSDAKGYIHTSGEVAWSDASGRTGVRFSEMPPADLHLLKQWLFLNALNAVANHSANHAPPVAGAGRTFSDARDGAAPPDFTSILIALQAVRREVDGLGASLEPALQLLAERAQSFTRAGGAAIALLEGEDMLCRATAGPDAPGLGVRLQVGSGFSGECVRTGRLLRCDDAEADPRVDREVCRILGIRSMIAVPVHFGGEIVGLLEVFSPRLSNFSANDDLVLQRLAETIVAALNRARRHEPAADQLFDDAPTVVEEERTTEEIIRDTPPSRSGRILLLVVAATLLIVLAWLTIPWIKSKLARAVPPSSQPQPRAAVAATNTLPPATDLQSLRKMAEQGDPAAQFAVGAHYATGDDVQQDYPEAVHWFSLAAEQGHVLAQQTLGAFYWAGRGVPQDVRKAYFWSILAQAGGDESSKYRAAILASRMTRSEIVSVQQQANDWLKQHQGDKPIPR